MKAILEQKGNRENMVKGAMAVKFKPSDVS